MPINVHYVWRELTGDGLLKQPSTVALGYGNQSNVNDGAPFENEDAAIRAIEKFAGAASIWVSLPELVLVKVYTVTRVR